MADLIGKDTCNAGFYQSIRVLGQQIFCNSFSASFGMNFTQFHEFSDEVVLDLFVCQRFGSFFFIVADFDAVFLQDTGKVIVLFLSDP